MLQLDVGHEHSSHTQNNYVFSADGDSDSTDSVDTLAPILLGDSISDKPPDACRKRGSLEEGFGCTSDRTGTSVVPSCEVLLVEIPPSTVRACKSCCKL